MQLSAAGPHHRAVPREDRAEPGGRAWSQNLKILREHPETGRGRGWGQCQLPHPPGQGPPRALPH